MPQPQALMGSKAIIKGLRATNALEAISFSSPHRKVTMLPTRSPGQRSVASQAHFHGLQEGKLHRARRLRGPVTRRNQQCKQTRRVIGQSRSATRLGTRLTSRRMRHREQTSPRNFIRFDRRRPGVALRDPERVWLMVPVVPRS